MFSEFRANVKAELDAKAWTYAKLSEKTGIAENTIKCFMCGITDSRRVAEKIADALECVLSYHNGVYTLKKERS